MRRKKERIIDGIGWDGLTARERQMLYPVTEGKANKVIAMELGISMRTVESHRARIFRKMNVDNAVQLARAIYGDPSLADQMRTGQALIVSDPKLNYMTGRRPRRVQKSDQDRVVGSACKSG
ncbi:response regulator transcription factor [Orrella daihaiensis]|uniref:Helix-turn-helix transcriptional regulator n=1 Tax=Orrella daihaiensis TaxID=2782176 RepID=A0ABY4AIT3_9BURK|nr:helix-turn-helix transcriptional regulator [Orrella daihaiensis]UOD50206.1 helix-turn-helix transcriptional regulator [Orrella daihaiensis]